MIESGPKIEERRVIKKELRSMIRLVHSCHVFFFNFGILQKHFEL